MQTQPVEDIDVVLGRFQAWSGSRNATEPKPDIRELPYEEALQSRRYRWRAADETPVKKKLDAEPGVVSAAPIAAQTAVSEHEAAQKKMAPARVRDTKRSATKRVQTRGRAVKAGSKVRMETKPEFREVLAKAVRPPEVIVAAQPVELSRQVAVSIRLAPTERALIKTRAAEAGITVSAYVRQCALEVEQLRAQVQQALATMEHRGLTSISGPVLASGFLARLMRRFFPASASTLTLRA
jgi:hypothetical protein